MLLKILFDILFEKRSKIYILKLFQSPEGELLSSNRQQRSREGSLYRVKTADVVNIFNNA